MRRCRTCGEEYSLWNAGGDGLCPPCREGRARRDDPDGEAHLAQSSRLLTLVSRHKLRRSNSYSA